MQVIEGIWWVCIALGALLILAWGVTGGNAMAADYSRAECPGYARMIGEHESGFVIIGLSYCGPCKVLAARMRAAEMPYCVIDADVHPLTAAVFPPTKTYPVVYWVTHGLFRRRVSISILEP